MKNWFFKFALVILVLLTSLTIVFPAFAIYKVQYPTYYCHFFGSYVNDVYNSYVTKHVNRNYGSTNEPMEDTFERSLSHSIEAGMGFEIEHLSGSLSFTVTETIAFSHKANGTVPPNHKGIIRWYAQYQPVKSNYTCYWRGNDSVKERGTVRVDKLVGVVSTFNVKPIKPK